MVTSPLQLALLITSLQTFLPSPSVASNRAECLSHKCEVLVSWPLIYTSLLPRWPPLSTSLMVIWPPLFISPLSGVLLPASLLNDLLFLLPIFILTIVPLLTAKCATFVILQ